MKKMLIIFALISVLVKVADMNRDTHSVASVEEAAPVTEVRTADGTAFEYVRYNYAYSAPSSSLLTVPRNNFAAGTGYHGYARRGTNSLYQSIILKNRKISNPMTCRAFTALMELFPSGMSSQNHHFINLCKLVI